MLDKHDRRVTYQPESVYVGVFFDVFPQVSARHPNRNELEGGDSDTQEG